MLREPVNFWKAFSASCWLWKHFPCKSCQDAWKSDSCLARGQVNMADEVKLRSPICLTFEANVGCARCSWALSWRRIGPFMLTNAGCRRCSFQCISSICWPYFSHVMISPDSESCSELDVQQTTRQWPWPIFGASLALGSALDLLGASQVTLVIKTPPANASENLRDAGSIPGLGRSPGGRNGNPLQYSCLENPMDRGAWQSTVHRVAKSWAQLSD